MVESASELKHQIAHLTFLRRIEIARGIISKTYGKKAAEYDEALEWIVNNRRKSYWFESSSEVLVAAELIRCRIKTQHQAKFGRWRADFVLPKFKVVLEIDGGQHTSGKRKELDEYKDAAIIVSLGPEWEIVRISDTLIRKRLQRLVPMINIAVSNKKWRTVW